MADKGNPTSSYTRRLKDKIKEKENKINDLEEEKEQLQEQLRDRDENNQHNANELNEEIAGLREEIARLREEIAEQREESKILKMEIGDFGKSNVFLENEMESIKQKNGDLEKEMELTKKKLKEHDDKLKTLGLSEDELIKRQLCSSVQQNRFDEIGYKSTKHKNLKRENKCNDHWITQFKSVKNSGNEIASPSLTKQGIEKAKMNLKRKKVLGKNKNKAVDKQKNIWQQTNSKLPQNGFKTATAMDDKGNTSSYTGRRKDKIKEKEKKINDLEEKKEQLQEKLGDHDENCQPKNNEINEEIAQLKEEIAGLREEIARLREENQFLNLEIEDFGKSNVFLENKMESIKQKNGDLEKELELTKKQLKEHDKKFFMFEVSEYELIIMELCSSVQQNILKIVLQEYIDIIDNTSIKYIEKYLSTQIEDEDEQDEARGRWKKLKKEIEWDDYLIIQLKLAKNSGNEAAHPSLTKQGIEKAKMNLREKKKLGENNIKAVDKLKTIWQQTNSKLLQNGPITRSAEERRSRKRPAGDWYRMPAENRPRKRLAEA